MTVDHIFDVKKWEKQIMPAPNLQQIFTYNWKFMFKI